MFQYKVEYRVAPNETAVGLDEFSSPNGWRVASTYLITFFVVWSGLVQECDVLGTTS